MNRPDQARFAMAERERRQQDAAARRIRIFNWIAAALLAALAIGVYYGR